MTYEKKVKEKRRKDIYGEKESNNGDIRPRIKKTSLDHCVVT